MATLDNLVLVTITQDAAPVSVDNFGVPLILGATDPKWTNGDVVRAYTSPANMLTDGYTSTSPEYLSAVAMCSGTTKPAEFYVGLRTGGNIADDLTAIFTQDNTAYGIVLAGLPDTDIIPAATAVEALEKILLVSSNDADIVQSGDADLASQLVDKGFNRTGLVFTRANSGGVLEAAWMGDQLPLTPGSNNWAYNQLAGVSVDKFTGNEQANLYGIPNQNIKGKNVNCYQRIAGANVTFPGMMASGRYIDLTIGADWLQANVQAAIYQVLVSAAKVPYTNAGVALLLNAVRSVMDQAAANGLIDANNKDYPIYVTAPNVNDVPVANRANRIAPTITFGGKLQGAINSAIISGTVAV